MAEQFALSEYIQTLYKYRVDVSTRTILISEDITNKTFIMFDHAMNLLENLSKDPITIKINTYGGDIYEAFAILERAQQSECAIITEGYGKIMSAGVVLLSMGDTRYISEYASVMVHCINYNIPRDRSASIKNEVKHSDSLEKMMFSYLAKRTKKPYTYWQSSGKFLDHYITAGEAIELGIADEFISRAEK